MQSSDHMSPENRNNINNLFHHHNKDLMSNRPIITSRRPIVHTPSIPQIKHTNNLPVSGLNNLNTIRNNSIIPGSSTPPPMLRAITSAVPYSNNSNQLRNTQSSELLNNLISKCKTGNNTKISTDWRASVSIEDRLSIRYKIKEAYRKHCLSFEELLDTVAAIDEGLIHSNAPSRLDYIKYGFDFNKRIKTKVTQLKGKVQLHSENLNYQDNERSKEKQSISSNNQIDRISFNIKNDNGSTYYSPNQVNHRNSNECDNIDHSIHERQQQQHQQEIIQNEQKEQQVQRHHHHHHKQTEALRQLAEISSDNATQNSNKKMRMFL